MQYITLFFAVGVPMVILDAVWLGVISKPFYAKQLAGIMSSQVTWWPVVAFYVLYAIAVAFFVVAPALAGALPWWQVLLRGAFLGLVAYGTYDLTNQATIASWPAVVTAADMAWGAFITGATSTIAYLILK
jgi:uncharacterized membrane protein